MSTRGIYGFHVNGADKLAYNHADSYPQQLGLNILGELSAVTDWDRVKQLASDLIPIHETRTLDANSEIFQAELRRHYDGPRAIKRPTSFYDLMQPLQGKLEPYLSGKLSFMATANEFIDDSLFCEWGYIANLDSHELEVYRGLQRSKPEEPSRYGSDITRQGYYPCKQIASWNLSNLPTDKAFLCTLRRYDISRE